MMRGKRIDLQLTQRLFTNRRELNQTLFKFIDFEFKYVFLDTTKIREREKKSMVGTLAGCGFITLAPWKIKSHAIKYHENKYF